MLFIYKQTNPEPMPPTTSSMGLSHSGPLNTCPNYPRARYQTTKAAPMPHCLLKLLKLPNPKLDHPASPIPSHGNHSTGSCPHFSSLPLVFSHVALHGLACPVLLGIVGHKLSLQWQFPPDLLASLCLNFSLTILYVRALWLQLCRWGWRSGRLAGASA